MLRKEAVFFLPALGVVAFDQLTKLWVRTSLPLGASWPEDSPVRLTHIANEGAVFGLPLPPSLLLVVTLFLVAFILFFYRRLRGVGLRLGLGMILGGGMGNLIDRLRLGYVTDFIDLRVWPVFNLADASIVVGTGLVILFLWKGK